MTSKLKIAFAGTPEIAKIVLAEILDSGFNVELVLSKADSIAGRGKRLMPSVVKSLAIERNITVLTPLSFKKNPEVIDEIKGFSPDIMVVVAYGLILPQEVLDIPRLGCVNIHVSLLPKYRGAAPIQRAILAGDKTTGITIIQMDKGLDTGNILLQKEVAIEDTDTSGTVHDKLAMIGAKMIVYYLNNYDSIKSIPQCNIGVTYANKIEKSEAIINWQQDASVINLQIRGFNPFPGANTLLDGEPLKIWSADILENKDSVKHKPGVIINITKDSLIVATNKDFLCIKELQFAGKKRLPVKDYLNGTLTTELIGTVLG
jgi:methionyl-tRNA formyltransferase